VCEHPEHDAINHALTAGVSYRTLEEQYAGVSRSALSRHAQHSDQATPPAAEPPAVSLCPPQDPDEQAAQRARFDDAVTSARQQLETVTKAIEVQAVELAKVSGLEAIRGFQPWRLDDDLRHLPEYQQWMGRPQKVKETTERLLTTWRQALQGLQRTQWGLAAHDRRVQQYEHERAFLASQDGQKMEKEYGAIHEALRAAERTGNSRLMAVYQADAQRVRERFLVAVSQAANRQAA
jgi:hypothetical protein